MISEERKPPEPAGSIFRSSSALALYIALTLVLTWPVGWNLNEPPLGGDPSQNAWNLWWVEKALTEPGQDLLFTNYISYPEGTSLALHSLSQLNGFLAIPLIPLFGILPMLRFLLLITFPLSGWGMFLLARRYTQYFLPAFLAGCIFAFCPYRMTRFNLEQIDMVSTQWIPFYILCLLSFLETRSLKSALGAAVFAVLQALSAWYYAGFLAVFTLFVFIYKTIEGSLAWREARFQKGLAVLVLLPLLLLSTTILPMVKESLDPAAHHTDQVQASRGSSSDLLGYLVPDGYFPSTLLRYSPLYLGWTPKTCEWIYTHFRGLRNEVTSFPGYGVLALIVIVLIKRDAFRRFWLWSALLFFIFSLGPMLQVFGKETLPLPYVLINHIPGLSIMRAPNRMTLMFVLSAALLVASLLDGAWQQGRRWPAFLFALAFLLEYSAVPIQRQHPPPRVSPLLMNLTEMPGEAVLNVPEALSPSGAYAADWYMYLQTLHGKKILGGYTSRIQWDLHNIRGRYPAIAGLEWESMLGNSLDPRSQVENLGNFRLSDKAMAALPSALESLKIKQILIHKSVFAACPATLAHINYHFRRLFGDPIAEDETLIVYGL